MIDAGSFQWVRLTGQLARIHAWIGRFACPARDAGHGDVTSTDRLGGIIASMESIRGVTDGPGTPMRCSGRLPVRSGTIVNGMLKAEAEDTRDV